MKPLHIAPKAETPGAVPAPTTPKPQAADQIKPAPKDKSNPTHKPKAQASLKQVKLTAPSSALA
jgi:hypothetical protein